MSRTLCRSLSISLTMLCVIAMSVGCRSNSSTTGTLGDPNPQRQTDDEKKVGVTHGDPVHKKPPTLELVYFDFNSHVLRPDALDALRKDADALREWITEMQVLVPSQALSFDVTVAGHCDERGTQEYNMALGEKRALAVREHLLRLDIGVQEDRIRTISFGEEKPAVEGHTEAAWAKNRRCEISYGFNS